MAACVRGVAWLLPSATLPDCLLEIAILPTLSPWLLLHRLLLEALVLHHELPDLFLCLCQGRCG